MKTKYRIIFVSIVVFLCTVFRFYLSEKRKQILLYEKKRTTHELARICNVQEIDLELIGGRFRNRIFMAETRALYRILSSNWNKDLFRYIDSDSYKLHNFEKVSDAYYVYKRVQLDHNDEYNIYSIKSNFGYLVIYETRTNTLLYLNRGL